MSGADGQQSGRQCVAWEQLKNFIDMKTGVDLADIRQSEDFLIYSGYETIVVLMSDLNPLKDVVIKIGNWVEKEDVSFLR